MMELSQEEIEVLERLFALAQPLIHMSSFEEVLGDDVDPIVYWSLASQINAHAGF